MITLKQYLGEFAQHPDLTVLREHHANKLLIAVNKLMALAQSNGVVFPINPVTTTQISGAQYGGFRPQDCPIGAPNSSHKAGLAVDIYDPDNKIDEWCMDNLHALERFGIYMEHPSATDKWAHWSTRRPGSGNRVFRP